MPDRVNKSAEMCLDYCCGADPPYSSAKLEHVPGNVHLNICVRNLSDGTALLGVLRNEEALGQ